MNELSIILGANRPDLIREETLATLFQQSAQDHAGKTALIFHDETLTYTELDRWSDAVAIYLNKKGDRPKQQSGRLVAAGFGAARSYIRHHKSRRHLCTG